MKILVVDDLSENRYMLQVLLQGYGYEVQTATDGVDALKKACRDDFDMIISDILMPRMDGFQLCREVKKDKKLKKIAFLFYTATYTEPSDKEFALSLGAERFVVKPTEPDEFINIVLDVVNKRRIGALKAPKEPIEEEEVYLKEYNQRLIRKLEEKMLDLEQANKGLRESEAKYRDLINNASDAVVVFEKTGTIHFVNPSFYEMTGYTADEVKKLHFSDLIHPRDLKMCSENFRKRMAGEDIPRNYELRIRSKSGKTIYIDNNASTIKKEGRITGILSIMRNITARKRAEEEKEKLKTQLLHMQKQEALGTLAGGIAHDFNNILTAILGYATLVRDSLPENGRAQRDLGQVLKAGERAKNLVQQILTFSRQAEQECHPVQVHLIVKEALKLLRASIPKTIEIRQRICTEDTTILADPTKIHQVMMNLCTNAYQAMRDHGGVLEVRLEPVAVNADLVRMNPELKTGPYLRLTVSDTGHGMDDATLRRIFEPYFSTKKKQGGTGLGLAVVHGIVSGLGGTISVESKLETGTTFHVYFPLADQAETSKGFPDPEPVPGGTESILYVDDEQPIAHLGQRMLESLGYDVTSCTSSVEALDIFSRRPDKFDLVITDQTMPTMTGVDLAMELMRIRPEIPVILYTGFDEMVTPELARQIGIQKLMMKPVAKNELASVIRKILD
ncbi:hypothetical protein GF1_23990 [Desulfolithobacter dissulfuricans]|uniref:histidine kinase n=1 Tax=Desulfolithobacter dissulfuricans TaxID=2795293 RepID=A0A915U294_9BACT|nr:response regulator [Desulfolithobacter dissulfuricans]BCO10023.1 hypothetical protein GF1_23990 [Desulfolithobacter dissulfuricans]